MAQFFRRLLEKPHPEPAAQAREIGLLRQELHNLHQRVDAMDEGLTRRLEFARQEIFLEIRAFTRADFDRPGQARTAPRIVAPERVQALRQRDGLRLNVGCGHKPDPDRINVDMRELPGVDVIAAADNLPFQAGELREVFSAHVLEHFPVEALRRTLLPAWTNLLAGGGELRAVVPDAQAMLAAHAQGQMDFETLRLITFGAQEYEGDFHHTMFSPESLADLMREAGLQDVRVEARGRPNGLCLECQVAGTKP